MNYIPKLESLESRLTPSALFGPDMLLPRVGSMGFQMIQFQPIQNVINQQQQQQMFQTQQQMQTALQNFRPEVVNAFFSQLGAGQRPDGLPIITSSGLPLITFGLN